MDVFFDKIRLLLFCILYVAAFPLAVYLIVILVLNIALQFGLILILFLIFSIVKKFYKLPLKPRTYIAIAGFFAYIISFCIAYFVFNGDTGFLNGAVAVNIAFAGLFIIILSDIIWNRINYIIDKNIKIGIFHKFRYETKNCIIELTKENKINNIYCYNKNIKENQNNFHICVIREIDNTTENYYFMQLLYDNYSSLEDFGYEEYIDFANKNDMFLRTYTLEKPLENSNTHLNELMRMNGISIEPKKININKAVQKEIANLPFINIITAKKIMKYIEERSGFKSFWEFAKFLKLNKNQGIILSKLVYVTSNNPIPEEKITENNRKYDGELDI